jgi:multidrug resistance efflux pump
LLTKLGLPIAAVALIAFAVNQISHSQQEMPKLPPPIEPPRNPFANTVAGAGMVEPETENIAVGSPVPGVVVEVVVEVGQKVKRDDPLFRLDDRQWKSELEARRAMAAAEKSSLVRLENEPRPEKIRMAEAQLAEAKAKLADARDLWIRTRKLHSQKVATEEDLVAREQAFRAAEASVARVQADLDMTKAGAWKYDLQVAAASVERSQMQVKQIETELERLVVRALVDGEVLQVNVRPGEFVGAPANLPLVVLGNVAQLHVRVDIDEYDIPRFRTNAPARATLKGQPEHWFPLTFVRVEPYVVPKKSLTGDNTERVDTRVLQVIYAIDSKAERLFVGQQLDVFIDASDSTSGEGELNSKATQERPK